MKGIYKAFENGVGVLALLYVIEVDIVQSTSTLSEKQSLLLHEILPEY